MAIFPSVVCLLIVQICVLAPREGFADEFVSGYVIQHRCLLLNESVRAPSGNLKPFGQLAPGEISTLYHELWHAYFLECETKTRGPLFKAFQREADARYAEFPADKRMEIHEEAVADFVDATVETFVSVKRFMSVKSPERREAIRRNSGLIDTYKALFADSYVGYYTRSVRPPSPGSGDTATTSSAARASNEAALGATTLDTTASDTTASAATVSNATALGAPSPVSTAPVSTVSITTSTEATSGSLTSVGLAGDGTLRYEVRDAKVVLGDFIRDARSFGLPVTYVEKAVAQLEAVVFVRFGPATPATATGLDADVVWSETPLRPADLALVERTLFEGLLAPDPNVTFAERTFQKLP